jgi:hypothetical protein
VRASTQRSKAQRLRGLHCEGDMLVLPNAWDGMSARVFEGLRFSGDCHHERRDRLRVRLPRRRAARERKLGTGADDNGPNAEDGPGAPRGRNLRFSRRGRDPLYGLANELC